jgi:hypothetical protein
MINSNIYCCAWPGALLGGERLGRRAQVVHVAPAAGSVLDVEQGRDARVHRRLRRRRQVLDPADRTGRRHRQGTHTHANNCTSRSPLGLQASTRQAACFAKRASSPNSTTHLSRLHTT